MAEFGEIIDYFENIHTAYSGIANRIEELIEFLNNPSKKDSEENRNISIVADKITIYLEGIQKFIKKEKKLVKKKQKFPTLTKEKRRKLLALLEEELQKIKKLEEYVKLEREKPDHNLVKILFNLNEEIKRAMAAEKFLLKE